MVLLRYVGGIVPFLLFLLFLSSCKTPFNKSTGGTAGGSATSADSNKGISKNAAGLSIAGALSVPVQTCTPYTISFNGSTETTTIALTVSGLGDFFSSFSDCTAGRTTTSVKIAAGINSAVVYFFSANVSTSDILGVSLGGSSTGLAINVVSGSGANALAKGPNAVVVVQMLPNGNSVIFGRGAGTTGPTLLSYGTTPVAKNFASVLSTGAGLDTNFQPVFPANSYVNYALVQADGKILVAGVNLPLRRLNADGSNDTTFTFNSGTNVVSKINMLFQQNDGKILVACGSGSTSGILRLTSVGSLDPAFHGTVVGAVDLVTVRTDGSIVIGAYFLDPTTSGLGTIQRINGAPAANTFLAGLNADGSLNSTFLAPSDYNEGYISALPLPNSQLLMFGPAPFGPAMQKLNADGSRDINFLNAHGSFYQSGYVYSAVLQADQKILVAGSFLGNGGAYQKNPVSRLNADGTVDTSFSSSLTGGGYSLATFGNQILASGLFLTGPNGGSNFLARMAQSTGTFDPSYNSGSGINLTPPEYVGNSPITGFLQADGNILVGQNFLSFSYAGTPLNTYFARVKPDGKLDNDLNVSQSGNRGTLVGLQSDGRILYSKANALYRLNVNGSPDSSYFYSPGSGETIFSYFPVTDNRLLISANRSVNNVFTNALYRINPSGSIDTTFQPLPIPGGVVKTITEQSNLRILVGGHFTQVANYMSPNLVRLNPDGSIDTSFFSPIEASETVTAIGTMSNGNIVVASSQLLYIMSYEGNLIISINIASSPTFEMRVAADDRIYIAGDLTPVAGPNVGLARLLPSGGVDLSYPRQTPVQSVKFIGFRPDGRLALINLGFSRQGKTTIGIENLLLNGLLDQ